VWQACELLYTCYLLTYSLTGNFIVGYVKISLIPTGPIRVEPPVGGIMDAERRLQALEQY